MKLEELKKDWIKDYLAIWQDSLPKEYQTLEQDFLDKVWNSSDFYEKASKSIWDDEQNLAGFIVIKVSHHPNVDGKIAWISALFVAKKYRQQGYATCLYQQAQKELKQDGIEQIMVGQEYDNFFSGIPNPNEANQAFFKQQGFWQNSQFHYDLEANVQHIASIEAFDVTNYETEFYTETLKEEQAKELLDFLEKEFPGRWLFEAKTYLEEKKPLSHVVLLRKKDTNKIKGYCMISLEDNKRGGLGPIGIAADVRGKTVGNYILCKSLQQLKKLNGEEICIDWTVLKDFYGQFEFTPIRTYLGSCKNI